MMKLIFVILCIILAANGKVIIILDSNLETCTKNDTADTMDFSGLELVPVNDTHTFINGTWRFRRDLKSPWKLHLYAEHYIRGQWLVQAYDRHYEDFCKAMKNPTEPWYFFMKDYDACPISAGTVWNFDMVPWRFSPFLLNSIPPHYMGRWRFSCRALYHEDGEDKHGCIRASGDVFDD